MNVLVDTSIWSLALRRREPKGGVEERELCELLREGRMVMMGAIRQEILSGVRTKPQFVRLRKHLRAFDDIALEPEEAPGVTDAAWTPVAYDISAYANPALQIRIGFNINNGGVWTCSQWNVDDITISGLDCV
jgi:hypothetical protein